MSPALQLQVSEAGTLSAILGGNTEIGATLNNLNVQKAFAAGLPFWAVKILLLHRKQINH